MNRRDALPVQRIVGWLKGGLIANGGDFLSQFLPTYLKPMLAIYRVMARYARYNDCMIKRTPPELLYDSSGKKWCKGCQAYLPTDHFGKHASRRGGLDARCTACRRAMDTTPERKASNRDRYIQKKYGISASGLQSAMESQGGVCAICGGQYATSAGRHGGRLLNHPSIDHCHKTGTFRALLCSACNTGIGMFKDDTTLLRKAIEYLEKHHSG